MTEAERPQHHPDQVGAQVLGVAMAHTDWFHALDRGVYLVAGRPSPRQLRVPVGDAQRLLRQTARVVADVPAKGSGDVVWTAGVSELLVRTGALELTCESGVVTVGVPVACDQLRKGAVVGVPFAVGSEKAPAGLVMSTLARPSGPAVVVAGWGEAITAFAWEALVHLAQSLCAATGADTAGDPLVPGAIGAARDVLLLQPMARHRAPEPVKRGHR
ncbi:hypothetical protein CS0771_47750 [Catellatospora sp. IY07-71]|uniref:hypothetical protein n=1 Tax=Catellatospora sp. IY07-71 TaxID=2728827 RepID=UPI001BB45497|nr:hypothetical protein [Catellatospora sp. IY07-71]BCJ75231.1 hypothetical protein CS0771_47750 [Catellatospora sp. IY07-71]